MMLATVGRGRVQVPAKVACKKPPMCGAGALAQRLLKAPYSLCFFRWRSGQMFICQASHGILGLKTTLHAWSMNRMQAIQRDQSRTAQPASCSEVKGSVKRQSQADEANKNSVVFRRCPQAVWQPVAAKIASR
eukprot:351467-Chlamydomonas_euryale.AAC.2